MTLKNNWAPQLCYFKLYASFRSHRWIQAGVTVRKRPIWVKMDDFLSRVTLQFDAWHWKTIGHLFYATSSFVHHFVAIGDFKLELQSGNAQFGQIRRFLEPCDLEIWQMTLNKANLRDLIAATGLVILLKLDLNRRFFSPCDLEIWWMTPKSNRAPLLCYFKLFASFRSHWLMQTGVSVRKRLIWVKIDAFF